MATGTVKWFDNTKGYGFIATADGSNDVFLHHTSFVGDGYKSLNEGANVDFEIEQGDKSLSAVHVIPL